MEKQTTWYLAPEVKVIWIGIPRAMCHSNGIPQSVEQDEQPW